MRTPQLVVQYDARLDSADLTASPGPDFDQRAESFELLLLGLMALGEPAQALAAL